MGRLWTSSRLLAAGALLLAPALHAQNFQCEDHFRLDDATMAAYRFGPNLPPPVTPEVPNPFASRLFKYAGLAMKHRLAGLASFYSGSLDGTLTANGETYRHTRMTAAHLTLPLGSWVEIRSRATGRKIRVRVNDRGPYVRKFTIDLSRSAAHALGVDVSEDRWVDIRIIALPGEDPLPQDVLDGPRAPVLEETAFPVAAGEASPARPATPATTQASAPAQ